MPQEASALSLLLLFLGAGAVHLESAEPSAGGKGLNMDYGPMLCYTVNARNYASNGLDNLALKGLAVKFNGDLRAATCFDTELLRYAAAWTGGFLDISNTHLTSYKGSREAYLAGSIQFVTRPVAGWSFAESFADPRPLHAGPMPQERGHWKGVFRHIDSVVLHYAVGGSDIYETPACEEIAGLPVFTRTVDIGPIDRPVNVLICDLEHGAQRINTGRFDLIGGAGTNATFVNVAAAPAGARLALANDCIFLSLPIVRQRTCLRIFAWRQISTTPSREVIAAIDKTIVPSDLRSLCTGGPPLWPDFIRSSGRPGIGRSGYVVDTVTIPEQNPWRSWMRPTAFDFFSDGRVALSTWNGDVWIVSGLDAGLQRISWKRFAAGLHEPLGLKVVDDVVHVLGRDGINRLRDLNNDGEADYYENVNSDVPISPSYHAFAMNLDTDQAGNFYHIRCGQRVDPALPLNGGMVRVTKDGASAELIATGLRAANGQCIGPKDEIICADNQGNWVPSSRINLIQSGKFYGYTPHARLPAAPTACEPPICWLPITVDNSSGGQAWITSERWGPLQGIVHTSYGKAALFLLMTENVDGQWQGGVFQLPLKFDSGIMRARFNPLDGQLYVCGLKGWQTTGPRDGALQRVRYTGEPVRMPHQLHVKPHGIEIGFTTPLNKAAAEDAQNWAIQQWNYRWTEAYGSDDYSVQDPLKKGRDTVDIASATLAADHKAVLLEVPKLQTVMQMRIQFRVKAEDGESIAGDIYNTVNRIPKESGLTRR